MFRELVWLCSLIKDEDAKDLVFPGQERQRILGVENFVEKLSLYRKASSPSAVPIWERSSKREIGEITRCCFKSAPNRLVSEGTGQNIAGHSYRSKFWGA